MSSSQAGVADATTGYRDLVAAAFTRLCGALDDETISWLLTLTRLVHIQVGDTLYHQGEAGDCLHIVLTGRLEVRVTRPGGKERIVAYPQPGDVVGEMALFSGVGRAATITAVRDTTLGAITRQDIDELIARQPQVFSNIARMIIARLTGNSGHIARRTGARTLMVVPLHTSLKTPDFCQSLGRQLLRFGPVLHLDSAAAQSRFGGPANADYGRALDRCEHDYDYLLLEADPVPSSWNRICQGYADKIVLLADASTESSVTELERWLFAEADAKKHHAEIELVLAHANATPLPRGTRNWLDARKVLRHHHIRLGNTMDMARLARCFSGNALALVLAGGGARGFAHLGVIRALNEAGIGIDAVGGASFGALAATGIARGQNDADSFAEHHVAFTCEDPLGDYTLPVVSLVRGDHLNEVLLRHLPMDIEDLWLPFFAVSSDLSTNQVHIHDRGPLWQAIRASVSLPAILPPSLNNGHLLVDGGVLNNLPVDIMRERVRGPIIAVDLAVDALQGTEHAAVPSSMEYLRDRLLPGRHTREVPTLSRVIMQITTMASRKEVQSARKLADLYLNPPLGNFDFLDWEKMREIAEVGYQDAAPQIKAWLAKNPHCQNRASFMHHWQLGKAA
ncbi:MAG: patatin-like phospholipase family protein [Pseudomonadota bacterium]